MQLPQNAFAIIGAYLSLMAILAVMVEMITNWLKLPSRSPLKGKASLEDILNDAKGWAVVGGSQEDPETWRERIQTLNQALRSIGEQPLDGNATVYDVIDKLSQTTAKRIQSEKSRRALIRVVSIVLGFALAWLFGLNTLTMLGPVFPEVSGQPFLDAVGKGLGDVWVKYLGFVLSGFAASAGSSFWHDQSARLRNLKNVMSIARETIPSVLTAPAPAAPVPAPAAPPTPPPAPEPEVVSEPSESPFSNRLTELARQSVEYVRELKRGRQLSVPETYIAAPWVWTEAAKENLSVSIEQIDDAVRRAFKEFGTGDEGAV